MSVTLKDVAALAGVSPSTVSRTCKDHPSISKETKERVRRAMQQLGYEYNASGNTSLTDTRMIGIVLPPSPREAYENPFYLEAIRGISKFCNTHGYFNTIITGKDEDEILPIIRNSVQQNKLDGFILLYEKENDPIADAMNSEGMVYVMIGKSQTNTNQTIYIDNDNILAGQDATNYLLQRGHRKIGFIGCQDSFSFSLDRKTGYQLAMIRQGLDVIPEFCTNFPSALTIDPEAIRAMFSQADSPTAFVVCDDILALAIIGIVKNLGFSVPEDISIISFNNSLFARLASPQLTSIDVNSFQLGIEAASQLINHLENPNLLPTKIIVPHFLYERESCIQIKQ